MNRGETLALFKQGKEAWNKWAEEMLAEKTELEKAGVWDIADDWQVGNNEQTKLWLENSEADFSDQAFHLTISFDGFIFPAYTTFENATFYKDATFTNVQFQADVSFVKANFKEDVWFFHPGLSGTSFSSDVFFDGAIFNRVAEFSECKFNGKVFFVEAVFSGPTAFTGTKFSGIAWFGKTQFIDGVHFKKSHFNDLADFKRAEFGDDTVFEKTRFDGVAKFINTRIKGNVDFDDSTFSHEVSFSEANMNGDTSFYGVQFIGNAFIDKVVFSGNALFDLAEFGATARFATCTFKGYTAFGNTKFSRDSDFEAIRSISAFTLQGAQFTQLPDFRQAHFTEAPGLDSMKLLSSVEPAGFWRSIFRPVPPETISKYRELKRLAIQGHDHEQEQIFFRGELRSRRGTLDRPWHWRWWFGIFYEVFSDFGSSLFRPIAGWFITLTGFALYYLSRHFSIHDPAYPTGMWGWFTNSIKAILAEENAKATDLSCLSGKGEPFFAALYLSMKKGLLAFGWEQSEKINQTYFCLYGVDVQHVKGSNVSELSPVIPDSVSFMAIPQTLLSAAFIFLFLLALRNQFRIK